MLKERILIVLQEHKGDYVSGQTICDSLGVTRTAVWKNILLLKRDGYVIDAATRKGYRLMDDSQTYNEFEIKKELKKVGLDLKVLFQKSVDSTNNWAFEVSKDYENVLLVADEQSGGKGRRGRSWVSPAGCGIWASYLMKPNIRIENSSMVTLIFALSVAQAIERTIGKKVEIKWPNDIVYQGKKICGILTEMRSDTDGIRSLVCGIGINTNTIVFPTDLEDSATSIQKAFGVFVNRADLIAKMMLQFTHNFEIFIQTEDFTKLKNEYEKILVNKGKDVFIMEGNTCRKAFCIGVNERGELIAEDENRQRMCIHSGEVSVRGIYGYV